jgi:hypothetical protein
VYQYLNDGLDIPHVWSLLESWQPHFQSEFSWNIAEGTRWTDTSLNIFMAKAYTRMDHGQEDNKGMYKFIFIITN